GGDDPRSRAREALEQAELRDVADELVLRHDRSNGLRCGLARQAPRRAMMHRSTSLRQQPSRRVASLATIALVVMLCGCGEPDPARDPALTPAPAPEDAPDDTSPGAPDAPSADASPDGPAAD